MTRSVGLETARNRLAGAWFLGSGIVFLVLVGQSLGGVFVGELEGAWAWALPNIAPTLSLIISVFASYALIPSTETDKFVVRSNFFTISLALSIFYLLNMLIVIISSPFATQSVATRGGTPIEVLHVANFWLGPLQGLTVASLAALFFTKTEEK
jgi:hypothetical protein